MYDIFFIYFIPIRLSILLRSISLKCGHDSINAFSNLFFVHPSNRTDGVNMRVQLFSNLNFTDALGA